MDFSLTDEQQAVAESATRLLAQRATPARVRELAEEGRYDDALIQQIAQLGWLGISVPESYGGTGLSLIEQCLVFQQLGRTLAPAPTFATTSATLYVQHAGSLEQRKRWLPALASGDAAGAVARVVGGAAKTAIAADALDADIVVLDLPGTLVLYERSQVEIEPIAIMDPTRRYATVTAAGPGQVLHGDVAAARDGVAILLAAESLGVAERALDMAVSYAATREQFGRPIGVNQAISHRCADMKLMVENARSLVMAAAWAHRHDQEARRLAAAAAAAYASEAGWRVPASAVQIHGGIGYTWEHDLHFLLKRGRVNAAFAGCIESYRESVAAELLDGARP